MAVFLGWLTGLAISQFRRMPMHEPGLPIHVTINFSIVAGACVIIVIGLWDDVFGIKPWMKIAGQVGAASLLLAGTSGPTARGSFSTRSTVGWTSSRIRGTGWRGFIFRTCRSG
jgi:hypothetical protein